MARYTFGGNAAVESSAGVPLPGAVGTAWTAQTGGSQVTDLQTAGGTAQTTVTTASNGAVPIFKGPDGTSQLWLDFGNGRFLSEATDYDEALGARLTTAENNITAMSTRIDGISVAAGGNVFRILGDGTGYPASSSAPARSAVPYREYVGPVDPALTTGLYVDGDTWRDTSA
jgi:hypothetical protein